MLALISGCVGGEDDADAFTSTTTRRTTTTAQPQPTTTTRPLNEQQYLDAVDAAGLRETVSINARPAVPQTDEDLLEWAYSDCEKVRSGGLPPDPSSGFRGRTAAEFLLANGGIADGTTYGERTKLAVPLLCPDNQPHLDAALSGSPPTMPPLTTFSGGTHEVGNDIAAGVYETTEQVSDCYWERVNNNGRIIDNGFVTGAPRVEVNIRASDAAFVSKGCGTWQKIG